MGSLEWLLFLKLSPEGSRGAPVYYDPRYDSQSNFPAAETQVERLLFWEGRHSNELMSPGTDNFDLTVFVKSFFSGYNLDNSTCICLRHQQGNRKLCFSSLPCPPRRSVKLLSAFVDVPFWSSNTPWPLEAPLCYSICPLTSLPSLLLLQIKVVTGLRLAGRVLPSMAAMGSFCHPDWWRWEAGWVWEWRASWCRHYWWPRSTSTHPAFTQTC